MSSYNTRTLLRSLMIIVGFIALFILQGCGQGDIWPFCCQIDGIAGCDCCPADRDNQNQCPISDGGSSGGGPNKPYIERDSSLENNCEVCVGQSFWVLRNPTSNEYKVDILTQSYNSHTNQTELPIRNAYDLGPGDVTNLGCSVISYFGQSSCTLKNRFSVEKRVKISSINGGLKVGAHEAPKSSRNADTCVKYCLAGAGCDFGEADVPNKAKIARGITWAASRLVQDGTYGTTDIAKRFGQASDDCKRDPVEIGMGEVKNTGPACKISASSKTDDGRTLSLQIFLGEEILGRIIEYNGTPIVHFPSLATAPKVSLEFPTANISIEKGQLESVAKLDDSLVFQTADHCLSWIYR